MHTRAPIATWRNTWLTGLVVLAAYGVGILAWRTLAVPRFDGLRLGEPELVRPDPVWRLGQHGVAFRYGAPAANALAIVGDSRVQRGIQLREFRAAGLGPVYALTRPAALTLELLTLVDEQPPARLVVCLSPLGLLNDQAQPLEGPPDTRSLPRRIDSWTSDEADMLRRRIAEPMLPPVWRYGWFGGFGQEKFFQAFRDSLRPDTREGRLGKLDELRQFLAALKAKGWHITCVRIPTYAPMRAIEDEAFDPALFTQMCAEVGVPFFDYGSGPEYTTSDGSHLGVAGAKAFSADLAQKLAGMESMRP
ncbi:MAG: hypothetical protein R3E96_09295 [Planctomycetota bacterium]